MEVPQEIEIEMVLPHDPAIALPSTYTKEIKLEH